MMSEQYVLVTDSACDLAPALLEQWDIRLIRMPFLFTDDGVARQELHGKGDEHEGYGLTQDVADEGDRAELEMAGLGDEHRGEGVVGKAGSHGKALPDGPGQDEGAGRRAEKGADRRCKGKEQEAGREGSQDGAQPVP